MGVRSQPSSRVVRAFSRASRSRTAAVSVISLALISGSLATGTTAASHAGAPERDTIALVDTRSGFTLLSEVSREANTSLFRYGDPRDESLMGDWDCDGEQTPGAYRTSTGSVYLRNTNTQGVADQTFMFGNPGDIALAGDFDGDGCDTLAIYRPSEAKFYIANRLGTGVADLSFYFGGFGDMPFVGDFDGDGVDTIGIFRPSVGFVALRNDYGGGMPKWPFFFGVPGDRILAGDWNGDGVDTIAAYRPSSGQFYYRNSNTSGSADESLYVGRDVSVLAVSGVDVSSSPGNPFDPDEESPVPPPSPTPGAPVEITVPGFSAPPPRETSGPIEISGEANVVIENLHISNPDGMCVEVTASSNVTIRNSTIGPCGDEAVYLSDVDGAVVSGNYITDTGNGVLVHRSESVRVDENAFVYAGRNFVQFDKVNGPGSSISGNRGQNDLGGSNAEDLISLFKSNGTTSSPIMVVGNHLRNGGPSDSGSGIMMGDAGGSHQVVEGNVLVNPGQVGIGVASGTDMTIRGNRVYGSDVSWSNTGVYVWNQYESACGNVEVADNQVNWTAAAGHSNAWWSGGGCGDVSVHGNDWNAPIGPGIF